MCCCEIYIAFTLIIKTANWGPWLKSFPRAAVTKSHKPGDLRQRKCIVSVLEARNPKWRCRQGHALSQPFGQNLFQTLLPSWWLPAIPGIPWLVDLSLDSLPLPSCGLLCVFCISVFSSYKDTSHGIRAHPNLVWTHFNFITSAKTLFPNKIIWK